MKKIKKFALLAVLVLFYQNSINAEMPYYLDFKYILNESAAGSKAQDSLKNKLQSGLKTINAKEKSIQEEEKKIISQKKIITPEEYRKQVTALRSKVAALRKEREILLDSVAKSRNKARAELLKTLNPIIKNHMKDKKIRMVINKNSMLLADENLDITDDIIKILNKNLKTIKLN